MVRVYKRYRDQRDRDEERWVRNIIAEAQAEQAANPMSVDDMLEESRRLAAHGEKQAKKLGIKPQDVNRRIHAFRARQQQP